VVLVVAQGVCPLTSFRKWTESVGGSSVAHGFLFGGSHGHERCSWLFLEGFAGAFPNNQLNGRNGSRTNKREGDFSIRR